MAKKKGRSREDECKIINERVKKKRVAESKRTKRRIECGVINGKVYDNGSYVIYGKKGIQNWYDTRTLIEMVTKNMDRFEELGHGRVCYINGRHQLQIRGKHLRRLLKKMPNVRQVGRKLIEVKS